MSKLGAEIGGSAGKTMSTRLQPRVRLVVQGVELNAYYRRFIGDMTIDMAEDGATQLVINCNAWDWENQRYVFVEDRVFSPGNEIIVWAGYEDSEACLGRFWVTDISDEYREDGIGFQVKALDAIHRMVNFVQPWYFQADTDILDIVEFIAGQHGGVQVDADKNYVVLLDDPIFKQKGDNDFYFLKMLAALAEVEIPWVYYDPYAKKDYIVFRKWTRAWQREVFGDCAGYWYNSPDGEPGSLHHFYTSLTTQGVPTQIEIIGYDREQKKVVRAWVKFDDMSGAPEIIYKGDVGEKVEDSIENGASLKLRVLENTTLPKDAEEAENYAALERAGYDVNVGKSDKKKKKEQSKKVEKEYVEWSFIDAPQRTIQDFAFQWFKARMDNFIQCEFVVVGDPMLRPHQIREFKGVSKLKAGEYLVTQVNHEFNADSGYVCRGHARKVSSVEDTRQRREDGETDDGGGSEATS